MMTDMELKAYKNLECAFNTSSQQDIVVAEDSEGGGIVFEEGDEIYLKSEADKVLAHNKHKRCLAMRNMCRYAQYWYSCLMEIESCKISSNNIDFRKYNNKYHFYLRWRKRWNEFAEKFKPNNSTAQ